MVNSTMQFKIRRLFRWEKCLTLLCVSLFSIHVTRLLTEYNKGETVVNIEISQLVTDGPPGITICPAGLDLMKMANINDKYKLLYKEFVANNYGSVSSLFNQKYLETVHKDINDGLLSLGDILNNYSFDYEEEIRMGKITSFTEMSNHDDDLPHVILHLNLFN